MDDRPQADGACFLPRSIPLMELLPMKVIRPMLGVCFCLLAACESEKKTDADKGTQTPPAGATRKERPVVQKGESAEARLARQLEEAEQMKDSPEKEALLEAIAWDAHEIDPEKAQKAFEVLPPGSEGAVRITGHFVMRLAEKDVEKAKEWAEGVENPLEKAEAYGRVAMVLASSKPAEAATLIAENMPAGRTRDRSVIEVMQRWAPGEPKAAATWIEKFPAGEARREGVAVVVRAWKEKPADAAAWIGTIENEEVSSEAVQAFVSAHPEADEAQREQMLGYFSEPELRAKVASAWK